MPRGSRAISNATPNTRSTAAARSLWPRWRFSPSSRRALRRRCSCWPPRRRRTATDGSLCTAHEAGWVSIGQQQVLDFSAWIPSRSVLGALVTGVFGIPADPRLIEVLGWLLYAVPVLVVFLWPARLAAAPRIRSRLLAATSAVLLIAAAVLAIMMPSGTPASGAQTRTVTDRAGHTAAVSLASGQRGSTLAVIPDGTANVRSIPVAAVGDQPVDGVWVRVWQ